MAQDLTGHIIGFATTSVAGGVVEIEDLFVDPDSMRRGVGRGLLQDLVTAARDLYITRVEVTANPHAIAFYQAVGFVVDERVETRFGPGLRMHRDI